MQKFWSRFNLSKYLIAAVLVIVVLFPKFPFIRIPGIYVSVRLEDFLLLALAIVTALKFIKNFRRRIKDKIFIAFVLFFGVGLVSLIAGAYLTQTVSPAIGLLHLLRRVEYAVPLFAVLTLFSRDEARRNLDFYIKVLLIVVLVAFIYGLGQRYLSFPVVDTQNDEYSKGVALLWTPGAHINSTFAGHYDLAAFIVLVLPIFSTLFFIAPDLKTRYLALGANLAGLWLLGASLSRVSLVAWMAAASIPLLILKKYKGLVFIFAAAILIVIAFPSLLGRYQRFFSVYAQSSSPVPTVVNEDRSTSIRLNVEWPRAVRALTKNPLIGTGYSSIGLATDNDYLRSLGEVGILGFAAFVLIFVRIGSELYIFLGKKDEYSGLEKAFILSIIGSLVGTFATALFIDIFEASKFATIFWLLVGYVLILIRRDVYD